MGNRSMFVGLDVHNETIDVSIAEGHRDGEVRHDTIHDGKGVADLTSDSHINGQRSPAVTQDRTRGRLVQRVLGRTSIHCLSPTARRCALAPTIDRSCSSRRATRKMSSRPEGSAHRASKSAKSQTLRGLTGVP